MSADRCSKNLWYLIAKLKTSYFPQIARFPIFFAWKIDKMTRHIAQEWAFRWKNIPMYCVWYAERTGLMCGFRNWFREEKILGSWNVQNSETKPTCLGPASIIQNSDSVQFIVPFDGSIHVLWTYQDRVLVFGYIERILTKPRLCDYRSIIACYLHMQPWVARFPLPDFQ